MLYSLVVRRPLFVGHPSPSSHVETTYHRALSVCQDQRLRGRFHYSMLSLRAFFKHATFTERCVYQRTCLCNLGVGAARAKKVKLIFPHLSQVLMDNSFALASSSECQQCHHIGMQSPIVRYSECHRAHQVWFWSILPRWGLLVRLCSRLFLSPAVD